MGRSSRRFWTAAAATGRLPDYVSPRGRRGQPRPAPPSVAADWSRSGRIARSSSPSAPAAFRGRRPTRSAVAREADVVELDLVEAGAHRRLRDVEVVVPDPLVVGIRPPEAGVVDPNAASGRPDREVRPLLGQDRVLEADDTADEVDPLLVEARGYLLGVVVAHRRSDPPGERRSEGVESDFAVLVLDVELDRVQAERRGVLLELPGNRGERHGHVDAADLGRELRTAGLAASSSPLPSPRGFAAGSSPLSSPRAPTATAVAARSSAVPPAVRLSRLRFRAARRRSRNRSLGSSFSMQGRKYAPESDWRCAWGSRALRRELASRPGRAPPAGPLPQGVLRPPAPRKPARTPSAATPRSRTGVRAYDSRAQLIPSGISLGGLVGRVEGQR